jgi:predicted DCC family thiol-disulfide oxidoreductase YuxK
MLMIFDSHCVLCSRAVAFILRHERAPTVTFASSTSAEGLAAAAKFGFSAQTLDKTVIVVDGEQVFTHSDAVKRLAQHLKAPWPQLAWLGGLLPRVIRDPAYSFVANRRYRLFGRRETCFVPPPNDRHRFLNGSTPDGS